MEFFDIMSISHRYMEILDPSTPEKIIKLGKLLKLKEGKRVIDFGCGPGLYATRLAQKGAFVTGIDFSENSINYARTAAMEKGLSIVQ